MNDLLQAAETVLAGLNARIDRAKNSRLPVPVFEGIAELHCAIEAAKAPAPEDWFDDPSNDYRWNAGCDFALIQLCAVLGVDPKAVRWDAATETLDGDVCAAIGNVLSVKYGEDFDPTAAAPAVERQP